jgi:hypothetical protein
MLVLFSLLLSAFAGTCPNYLDQIEAAEAAIPKDDYEALDEALALVREGLTCGPVLESKALRARLWLAHAVLFDWRGDRPATDDALYAAWRTNPQLDLYVLPRALRQRFTEVAERPSDTAKFRLSPPPLQGAVLFIDGVATSSRRSEGGLEETLTTTTGLHVLQLVENLDSMTTSAAKLVNLPGETLTQVNIEDDSDPFGGGRSRDAFPVSVLDRGPSGGCAGKK